MKQMKWQAMLKMPYEEVISHLFHFIQNAKFGKPNFYISLVNSYGKIHRKHKILSHM